VTLPAETELEDRVDLSTRAFVGPLQDEPTSCMKRFFFGLGNQRIFRPITHPAAGGGGQVA